MAVLDTAAIIDLFRRPRAPVRRRAWHAVRARVSAGETMVTTRINVAELYAGVQLSHDPVAESAKVEFALGWLDVLEFNDHAAHVFGAQYSSLRRIGRLCGDMDLLIAAIAVANGHSVLTPNVRHFAGIPFVTVYPY